MYRLEVVNKYLFILTVFSCTEIKLSESKSRVRNIMVQNPIYDGDGPVYESVQTQLETELNISQSEDTTDQRYNNLQLSLNDTARYIDPLVQLQYLYTDNIVSDDGKCSYQWIC